MKNNVDILKTRPEDHAFHRARTMFCIKDGQLLIAPEKSTSSHLEWFKEMGWLDEKNTGEFLEKNIRGFYLRKENQIYCYKGVGFEFDDSLVHEVLQNLSLFNLLQINDKTELHMGPKDAVIQGVTYRKMFVGTFGELTRIRN